MSNAKTEKREVDSIVECAEELKCDNLIIVTSDDSRLIEKKNYKIKVVPFSEF
jgi:predicted AAA+ superfamily ATPase